MGQEGKPQSGFFRGIYEFEDPSGSLVAAKIPSSGTVDLFAETVVVIKPNQSAMFIYRGEVADIMPSGTFQINTHNVPVLTKLASWKFGFESPLRCELVFFANQLFTSRRWGTSNPVLVKMDKFDSLIPIRAFGNFNIQLRDPGRFFGSLFGTRSLYSVAELDEFIQGQILEFLPVALQDVKQLEELSRSYEAVSKKLTTLVNQKIAEFGFIVSNLQVLSALPSKEIIQALEAKSAIQVIGSQKDYLLYKAANSLDAHSGAAADPLQAMMGLMLSKGLIGSDYHDKEREVREQAGPTGGFCAGCGSSLAVDARFCQSCGKKL